MDTSDKAPKRPRDMNQLANLVGRIATGQAEEPEIEQADPKDRSVARPEPRS